MNNELHHYGILGMKWGVRRYVNEDGTLTDKGKKRYSKRHGVGKYLYDTNKVRQRKRKIASVYSFSSVSSLRLSFATVERR